MRFCVVTLLELDVTCKGQPNQLNSTPRVTQTGFVRKFNVKVHLVPRRSEINQHLLRLKHDRIPRVLKKLQILNNCYGRFCTEDYVKQPGSICEMGDYLKRPTKCVQFAINLIFSLMFICKHVIDEVDLKNTAEIRDMLSCTPYMYYLLAVSHRSAWLPQHAAVKTKSETDRENQNDPDCSTSVVYVQGQSP